MVYTVIRHLDSHIIPYYPMLRKLSFSFLFHCWYSHDLLTTLTTELDVYISLFVASTNLVAVQFPCKHDGHVTVLATMCRLVLCISAFGVACILILGFLPNLTQFLITVSWMDILLVRFASVLGLMMQMGIAVGVLLRHYRWKSWSEHKWSTNDTRRTSTHNGNEYAVMGPN